MGIKGILFDKDGTLIDFYEVWGKAAQPVMERILRHYGLPNSELIMNILWDALGVDADGTIRADGALAYKSYGEIAKDLQNAKLPDGKRLGGEDLAELLQQYFFDEVCVKRETYPTFTDMGRLAEGLQEQDIRMGIATTDSLESAVDCAKKIGLRPYLSFYGTSGIGMPEKPDGKLIACAAGHWKIAMDEIAVVGDTPNDMRFAKNGGAYAIGVLSGTGKKEELEPLADLVIPSVDDLIPAIDGMAEHELREVERV